MKLLGRGHLQQLRILTLTSRTVSGNTAEFGGGIFALNESSGYTTMESSPISSNTASAASGGILNGGGVTSIQYSTITEKTATPAAVEQRLKTDSVFTGANSQNGARIQRVNPPATK